MYRQCRCVISQLSFQRIIELHHFGIMEKKSDQHPHNPLQPEALKGWTWIVANGMEDHNCIPQSSVVLST